MPPVTHSTTPELAALQQEIEGYATEYGLDCFTTIFEVVDYRQICEIAAYGGFPIRYPHWRFGMEYDKLIKSYSYGLSKIYELVINTDPCYAYLLEGNRWVDQKLVMAHVYGHCDFLWPYSQHPPQYPLNTLWGAAHWLCACVNHPGWKPQPYHWCPFHASPFLPNFSS